MVIGGWQINDETIIQNGGPLSITQTNLNSAGQYGTTGVGGSTQRPNLIPGVKITRSGRPQGRLGPGQKWHSNVFQYGRICGCSGVYLRQRTTHSSGLWTWI